MGALYHVAAMRWDCLDEPTISPYPTIEPDDLETSDDCAAIRPKPITLTSVVPMLLDRPLILPGFRTDSVADAAKALVDLPLPNPMAIGWIVVMDVEWDAPAAIPIAKMEVLACDALLDWPDIEPGISH